MDAIDEVPRLWIAVRHKTWSQDFRETEDVERFSQDGGIADFIRAGRSLGREGVVEIRRSSRASWSRGRRQYIGIRLARREQPALRRLSSEHGGDGQQQNHQQPVHCRHSEQMPYPGQVPNGREVTGSPASRKAAGRGTELHGGRGRAFFPAPSRPPRPRRSPQDCSRTPAPASQGPRHAPGA